jgi:two-component system, CitB family, sensor kinase
LVTIVGNLLDNAFDAVSSCERKEVSIDFLTTEDRLWIQVHDSGPGLPDGERDDIFTLGFSSKKSDGAQRGVGLSLVRLAVTRMGGELTVDNDEGALFTVSLPLGGPASSANGFRDPRHG